MLIIPLPPVSLPDSFPGIPTRNETTIVHRVQVGANLTLVDPDSITLTAPNGTFGVRRQDTGEVVAAAGTPMEKDSLGVYTYTFTDPAPRLSYEYYVRWEYGGEVHWVQAVILGSLYPDGTLYDLLPQCETMLPGILQPFLKQQMRFVAQDFCRQTLSWRESLPAFTAVEGQTNYLLTMPPETSLGYVYSVSVDGSDASHEVTPDGTLYLPGIVGGESVVVEVSVFPTADCVGYPLWFIAEYGQALVSGTLARCKVMLGRPWASDDWRIHNDLYLDSINRAKVRLIRQAGREDVHKRKGIAKNDIRSMWPVDWR